MIASCRFLLVLLSFLGGARADDYTAVRWLSGQEYARRHQLPSLPPRAHANVAGRPLFSWDLPAESVTTTERISQTNPPDFSLKNTNQFDNNEIEEKKHHSRNVWWPWKNYKEWMRSRGQNYDVKQSQRSNSEKINILSKTNYASKLQIKNKKKHRKKNHVKKLKNKKPKSRMNHVGMVTKLQNNKKQTVSRMNVNISAAVYLNKTTTKDTNCNMINKDRGKEYLSEYYNGQMKIQSKSYAEDKHRYETFNDTKGTGNIKHPLIPEDFVQSFLVKRKKEYAKDDGDKHDKSKREYKAQCFNFLGTCKCLCPPGFRLDTTSEKCLDINECTARNGHGPCQGECTNTVGSYTCSCANLPGTRLASDRHSCEDIDECNSGTNLLNCSHGCINTVGTAFCYCPDGYELDSDWRTCKDVDECASVELQSIKCLGRCVNIEGSYQCLWM